MLEVEAIKLKKIGLLLFVVGGLFIIYFTYNPSSSGFFIPCPFHYFTGYNCPGCGSQRAIHQIFHGNLYGAFRLNPLMVLTLPILIYGLGITSYNFVFSTEYRFKLFYNKIFIYGYFGIAIIYWVVRNLPYYPFNLLAPTE